MTSWIWFPGDFEIYHGMKQNFEREERDIIWPAYWQSASWHHSVKFTKSYDISKPTSFTVSAQGEGYVALRWLDPGKEGQYDPYHEEKYPIGSLVSCPSGSIVVEVVIANLTGLPCIYVEGEIVQSDNTWMVTDFVSELQKVGCNTIYCKQTQNPLEFEFDSDIVEPVEITKISGGVLYDFGRELTAETVLTFKVAPMKLTLAYGESKEEALDVGHCYLRQKIDPESLASNCFEEKITIQTRKRAFRYLFIPDFDELDSLTISAKHLYLKLPVRGKLETSDKLVQSIWNISEETFKLVSGPFFIDGIKRDRWIWSGDAYQSYFVNRYLFYDQEICERTILALRGNELVSQHINGILDYSLFWLISIADNYLTFGNKDFLENIFPKIDSLWKYCMGQTNDLGFIYGREQDWVFIDWAPIDQGPDKIISEEQILFAKCYESMILIYEELGLATKNLKSGLKMLKGNIRQYFWDDDQGAFIDSYSTGMRQVSRHSNLLAVVFGFADEKERASILENVIVNPAIVPIKTPYFKFYELAALALLGHHEQVLTNLKAYWGGMIDRGATTFWEEFDPNQTSIEQYGMYDDPFGKSLCHAWGANPIFILSRYFAGLFPTSPGYQTFCVEPNVNLFESFSCQLPVNQGQVEITWDGQELSVKATVSGGVLKVAGKEYFLEANKAKKIDIEQRN